MWIPYKQKVVSVQDVIFNEGKIWDRMPIQHTSNEIKVMDETIGVLQLLETETDDVQLEEDVDEEDMTPLIAHQNNQKAEDLDAISETKNQTIDDDLV